MGGGVFTVLQGSETIQLYKIIESSELYSMTERKSALYPKKVSTLQEDEISERRLFQLLLPYKSYKIVCSIYKDITLNTSCGWVSQNAEL